jgi:hypothetical protein
MRGVWACVFAVAVTVPALVAAKQERSAGALRKACNAGEAKDCVELAVRYATGDDVSEDRKRSAQLYGKACDAGGMTGCFRLGLRYVRGDGVKRDMAKALTLYEKACDAREASACLYLGLKYDKGEGAAADRAKAAQLFQKACDAGNASGCSKLGLMYSHGQGVSRDDAKAAQLFQKACEAGEGVCCKDRSVPHYPDSAEPVDDTAYVVAVKAVLGLRNEREQSTYYLQWQGGQDPPKRVLAGFVDEPYLVRKASVRWDDALACGATRCAPGILVECKAPRSPSSTQLEITVAVGDPGWRSASSVLLVRDGAGWRSERVMPAGVD